MHPVSGLTPWEGQAVARRAEGGPRCARGIRAASNARAGRSATLLAVKALRVWFVVLLACLLPFKGAMAVTMPRVPAGDMRAVELQGSTTHRPHADAATGHGHPCLADTQRAPAHDDGAAPPTDPAGPGQHTPCSASCAVPPLPSAAVAVAEPPARRAVTFPRLRAPAPTFQSDGPERPPRPR